MSARYSDNRIRVVLADDSKIIRDAVRTFLAKSPGILVVGEAASDTELFRLLREKTPDVLVMDLHMCVGSDSMSALRVIRGLGIVVMSALVGPESKELAAKLGIKEVLEKSELPNTLMNAIKAVCPRHSISTAGTAVAP